ncbi:MAG: hypothetical protein R2848_05800 [Thermomicrobiales bacterium]
MPMSLESGGNFGILVRELTGDDANLVDHCLVRQLDAVLVKNGAAARSELGVVDAVFPKPGEDERRRPIDQPAAVFLGGGNGVVLLDRAEVTGDQRDMNGNLRTPIATHGDGHIGDTGLTGDAFVSIDEIGAAGLGAGIGAQQVVHSVVIAICPTLSELARHIGRRASNRISQRSVGR